MFTFVCMGGGGEEGMCACALVHVNCNLYM